MVLYTTFNDTLAWKGVLSLQVVRYIRPSGQPAKINILFLSSAATTTFFSSLFITFFTSYTAVLS